MSTTGSALADATATPLTPGERLPLGEMVDRVVIGNQETTNPALLRAIERDGILLQAKKNG